MRTTSSFAAAAALLLVMATAGPALAVTLDPPTVEVAAADRTSVTLGVSAGPSGAPGGFIVEFMRRADFLAHGQWPDEESLQDCTFTGIPTLNVTPGVGSFRLDAGEYAGVSMGKLFDETGLSAATRDELSEGTEYVFRARAAATGGFEESPSSVTVVGGTLPRGPFDCTLTQGFWKTHPERWTRVASVMLGTVTYSQSQLLSIFNTPARGNGLISLAHELIAAKLNELLGAIPTPGVQAAIAQADALIGGLVVPSVGTGSLAPSQTTTLTNLLDNFNNGTIGPGHCEDTGGVVGSKPSTWGSLKLRYR